MYYINIEPDKFGSHGNPTSIKSNKNILLPENLTDKYIATKGFAILTIVDNELVDIHLNEEAIELYNKQYPDIPTTIISESEDINSMLIDHEYRLVLLELGIEV